MLSATGDGVGVVNRDVVFLPGRLRPTSLKIREMTLQRDTFDEARKLATQYGLAVPERGEKASKYNSFWQLRTLSGYHALQCNAGQACFANTPNINRWLRSPGTMWPGLWVKALQLRSGYYLSRYH